MVTRVYGRLAGLVQVRLNCIKNNNSEWQGNHEDKIADITEEYLPSGGGIDSGCRVDLTKSTGEKLVIASSFHVMDEHGSYCGWVDFKVVVTPSLASGINLNIIGNFSSNKNTLGLKDYLYDTFHYSLVQHCKG